MSFNAGQKVRASQLATGLVGQARRTSNTAGITTTETVADTITFTAVAGRRYRLIWDGGGESTVALDTFNINIRYKSGASLTVTGSTLVRQRTHCAPVANRHIPFMMVEENLTGIAAGQTTIGVSWVRTVGSGTITLSASATNEVVMFLEDIGT